MIAFGWVAGGWALAAVFVPWRWLQVACAVCAFIALGMGFLAVAVDREQARRERRQFERDEAMQAAVIGTYSASRD